MAVQISPTWVQGQDLEVDLIYKEGPDSNSLTVINLSTGYSIRMDIVDTDGNRLYTFNSEDIPDVDPLQAGSQPDTVTEAVLSSGAGGTANIEIAVSRALTLPGGELYSLISETPPKLTFLSDIFLRNTNANKQWKIATLTITVEKSYTLWP
jgi:hypothetical protein